MISVLCLQADKTSVMSRESGWDVTSVSSVVATDLNVLNVVMTMCSPAPVCLLAWLQYSDNLINTKLIINLTAV